MGVIYINILYYFIMFYVYIFFTVSNEIVVSISDTDLMKISSKDDSEMIGNNNNLLIISHLDNTLNYET